MAESITITPVYANIHKQFKEQLMAELGRLERTDNLEYLTQIYPLISSLNVTLGAVTSTDDFYRLREEYTDAMTRIFARLNELQELQS